MCVPTPWEKTNIPNIGIIPGRQKLSKGRTHIGPVY